jgi:hypothetical protein
MTALQPVWIAPLIQSDARLGQAIRFSVSNLSFPGAHPFSYGNNHGVTVLLNTHFSLEADSPAYFRDHSATLKDGFGNAYAQAKWRIASGNAQHGNYVVSALLNHGFAPRAYQNGMLTSTWTPSLAAGRALPHVAVISTLGGVLPTGKIQAQGRVIEWNATAQAHPSQHVWLDVENNTAFNRGGPFDGLTQNFVTPVVFYMVRRKSWKPEHASMSFDCGMQIATTRFHQYNHNLITDMRVFF